MVVLGISLGTTTTGIAVLNDGELIYWHTHSFRDKWSPDKAALITSRYGNYVSQYKPKKVVVKIPPVYHHSGAIKQLLEKIKELFSYHGCMVEYKTKDEVKEHIPEVANHNQLMAYAIEHYPILLPEYEQAMAGKNNYHAKLFDAVIAAHQGVITNQ
jgi:RNase H-fold protein (predicted Holliday junction resolvase)